MENDTGDPSQSNERPISHIPSDEALERDLEEVAGKSLCLRNDGSKTTNAISPSKRDEIDNSNLHYEESVCVYTNPVTKDQYIWDSNKHEWVVRSHGIVPSGEGSLEKCEDHVLKPETEVQNTNPESVGLLHCPPYYDKISSNDYEFDGESYCYKDPKTGVTYKFDNSKQSWVVKDDDCGACNEECVESGDSVIKQDMSSGTYGYEGDTHTYTDATDGTVYIWDRERNAWFPKVDDDFLALYQMNYGFTEASTPASAGKEADDGDKKETSDEQLGVKRKAGPQEPSWFEMDDEHNTKVYVSNLPLDITDQEFLDVMQKCGLVMKDAETGKMKIKLYTEPDTNQLKGDGLCSYIKIESVDLALKLLDGCEVRGHKLHVERAKFQMKGNYDPNLKPKKQKKKVKEKLKKMQEKLFDWHPDKLRGERSKHEKVVIVKNLFDPAIFDKDVSLLLEFQQDLREECSKCGTVRKVAIYDRHPEGVAQITFRDPEEADACVTLLNGRWFGQRKITAETWDGKTKYKIAETDVEVQQRLQKWDKFLVSGEVAAGENKTYRTENRKEECLYLGITIMDNLVSVTRMLL
ncbi:HIV Tat-specific factor 1-like protein [Zootermopsis nevadensis]|uniref:17S U2 SnRNP complex component HTATSF1 n=1 Tax=Zootermopsis nevadensis TaxID=136037 RepID=A0A067QYU2_ZOONE|nr:HIV Tat-specific factor 1-like protein [Zootermopsis nevadensis]